MYFLCGGNFIFIFLRIPLHLFPVETQNKILEVEEDEEEEEVDEEKYIDSSSFRQARPQPLSEARLSAVDITLR